MQSGSGAPRAGRRFGHLLESSKGRHRCLAAEHRVAEDDELVLVQVSGEVQPRLGRTRYVQARNLGMSEIGATREVRDKFWASRPIGPNRGQR